MHYRKEPQRNTTQRTAKKPLRTSAVKKLNRKVTLRKTTQRTTEKFFAFLCETLCGSLRLIPLRFFAVKTHTT